MKCDPGRIGISTKQLLHALKKIVFSYLTVCFFYISYIWYYRQKATQEWAMSCPHWSCKAPGIMWKTHVTDAKYFEKENQMRYSEYVWKTFCFRSPFPINSFPKGMDMPTSLRHFHSLSTSFDQNSQHGADEGDISKFSHKSSDVKGKEIFFSSLLTNDF